MQDKNFWSRYVPLSLVVHVIGAVFLFCSFPISTISTVPPTPTAEKIIDAVALDQSQVTQQVKAIKARQEAAKVRDNALQQKNNQLEKSIQTQQKKLAQLQQAVTEQQKAALALKRQQQEQKQELSKKNQANAEAKKNTEQQRLKIEDTKKITNKKPELAIAETSGDAEDTQPNHNAQSQAARAAELQSIVNQYTQLIIKAISAHWLIPATATEAMTCRLLIELDSTGVVKNVQILQSSQNPALDQSAVAAVYKASPLPLPRDAEALDNFRRFSLTVTPKDVQYA